MNIIWNYKIDLVDREVFEKIEKEREIKFPNELKELIIEGNAATPDKYHFMVGINERILGAILSYNENEIDTDSVYTALEVIKEPNLVPFGIDPFGNYICMNIENKMIVYWEHESGKTNLLDMDLESFINSLY